METASEMASQEHWLQQAPVELLRDQSAKDKVTYRVLVVNLLIKHSAEFLLFEHRDRKQWMPPVWHITEENPKRAEWQLVMHVWSMLAEEIRQGMIQEPQIMDFVFGFPQVHAEGDKLHIAVGVSITGHRAMTPQHWGLETKFTTDLSGQNQTCRFEADMLLKIRGIGASTRPYQERYALVCQMLASSIIVESVARMMHPPSVIVAARHFDLSGLWPTVVGLVLLPVNAMQMAWIRQGGNWKHFAHNGLQYTVVGWIAKSGEHVSRFMPSEWTVNRFFESDGRARVHWINDSVQFTDSGEAYPTTAMALGSLQL